MLEIEVQCIKGEPCMRYEDKDLSMQVRSE